MRGSGFNGPDLLPSGGHPFLTQKAVVGAVPLVGAPTTPTTPTTANLLSVEQFGKPLPDRTPEERAGAYAIALNEGRLLVVEYMRNLHLPGGALVAGEVPEDALHREVLEETGYEIERAVPLGQAAQYVASPEGYFNKICAFFAVDVGHRVRNYYSPGHSPEWVPLDDAIPRIAEDASAWAIRRHAKFHPQSSSQSTERGTIRP